MIKFAINILRASCGSLKLTQLDCKNLAAIAKIIQTCEFLDALNIDGQNSR